LEERFIVFPVADIVGWNGMEGFGEYFGVGIGGSVPEFFELLVERISDHAIGWGVPVVSVGIVIDRCEICIGLSEVLEGEKTKVLSEKLATERGGEFRGCKGLTVHQGINGRVILDGNSDFGVVVAELRTIVEISRTTDNDTIIRNKNLGMDVELCFSLMSFLVDMKIDEEEALPSETKASNSASGLPFHGIRLISGPLSI